MRISTHKTYTTRASHNVSRVCARNIIPFACLNISNTSTMTTTKTKDIEKLRRSEGHVCLYLYSANTIYNNIPIHAPRIDRNGRRFLYLLGFICILFYFFMI